jgi:site-specific recombinase XerD
LRHYFCSTLIRRGASVEAVRVLAGHNSLMVTQRYVHATGTDLRAAIAKLHGNGEET